MADRPGGNAIDPELLDRYLAGECSEQEAASVRRYLMAHPDLADALSSFLGHLDAEVARPEAPDARASWSALQQRMREARPVAPGSAHSVPRTTPTPRHVFAVLPAARTPWWRSAAAIACVTAGLGAAALYHATRTAPARPDPRRDETFVTSNRERAELRLSDGTRVHLAPASRLRVSADFGEARRDVYLEGEGYFEVEHDARRPFAVYAGAAVARDVGTAFAVRSYSDEKSVQVVVRSGVVAMSRVGTLRAGDLGRLADTGASSVIHGVPVADLLGWLDGRLAFRDAPLSTVLAELKRWHDTDVRLADPSLGALPYTGALTDGSFRASLELVAATLGLRVRHVGAVYRLERGARPAGRHPPVFPPITPS